MEGSREKFTITISQKGVTIYSAGALCLELRAGEALMLLDILQHEKTRLEAMAAAQSPLPLRFTFSS